MPIRFNDTMQQDSPYWEKCARHQNKNTTRNIAHLFLCDECAILLTRDCFNDRPPIHHGTGFNGYCGLCNDRKEIALRQWFIDQICLNVVRSYPKSVAASKLIKESWDSLISPVCPNFTLEEIDVVRILPYIPRPKSATTGPSAIDFKIMDNNMEGSPVIFFVELKTGPSSICDENGMKEFQLDVNDYEDIVSVMRAEQKPAYVFHAQVIEEYQLPTKRSVGVAVWWTDIFSLRGSLIRIGRRRGEDKYAGYYHPSAFKPMTSFSEELNSRNYIALAKRLATEGIEDLPS